MEDNILGMLGLMKKASAVAVGEDKTAEAVLSGKARLLLLPADAGEKKAERAERYTDGRSCEIVRLPFVEKELSSAFGTESCTMAAITDLGFADSFIKRLAERNHDAYGLIAETIHAKLLKINRRKAEKPGIKARKK